MFCMIDSELGGTSYRLCLRNCRRFSFVTEALSPGCNSTDERKQVKVYTAPDHPACSPTPLQTTPHVHLHRSRPPRTFTYTAPDHPVCSPTPLQTTPYVHLHRSRPIRMFTYTAPDHPARSPYPGETLRFRKWTFLSTERS